MKTRFCGPELVFITSGSADAWIKLCYMFDGDSVQIAVTGEQVATLARIEQSFDVDHFTIRTFDGLISDHKGIISAHTRVRSGEMSSASAEWIIRNDGEILSRASAAAEPDEWLRDGQQPV